jgi:hypothetical protein
MVSRVVDSGTFEITLSGEVSGLSGLTAGEAYFLSAATAGAMTVTEPSVIGQVSVPLGVASSTTTFYVAPKRGNIIGGTNARTQISLANNTTANIQDVSAYDAGQMSGWFYIDATTDYKFYFEAPFAKNGAGNNYNISPSYVGDTPPAGFSVSITAAGVIQYTMPNVSGFSAANVNYALNVPAVGATFPLSIDASTIQSGTLAFARMPVVQKLFIGTASTAAQTNITSTTAANLPTPVNLTFTAPVTGKYKVYANCVIIGPGSSAQISLIISPSAGTVLQEMRVNNSVAEATTQIPSLLITLNASTSYTFNIQAFVSSGTGSFRPDRITGGTAVIAELIEQTA